MDAKSNPQNLIVVSDQVRQNNTFIHKDSEIALSKEVVIRPLPPEIDKIVKKFLSRY
jgi:hypothetical protein